MKRRLVLIWAFILIASALFVGLSGCSDTAGSQPINLTGYQQGIWVNGEGKIAVTPNIANLSLGITAQAGTVAQAQSQATTAMSALMSVLAYNGIAAKDIQTENFSIQQISTPVNVPTPAAGSNSGSSGLPLLPTTTPDTVTMFQVSNMVTVNIRTIANTGTIIDAVTAAGGDLIRIDSVSFSVDQPEQYYSQVRQLAMADAVGKAQQLAKLAGVTLGKATYISENSSTPVYNQSAGLAVPAATTSISPGQTDIVIDVQVAYAIK
jgi:hypothetical protein